MPIEEDPNLSDRSYFHYYIHATLIMSEPPYHEFDNGIRILSDHILPLQKERYREINLHEPEEEEFLMSWLGQQTLNPVILDVGAAVGYYSILLKKEKPGAQIHLFEPLPRHREYIRLNATLNEINYEELNIREEALSDNTGIVKFRDSNYSSRIEGDASRHLGLCGRFRSFIRRRGFSGVPADESSVLSVATVTMDDYLDRHQLDPDLVKIDVQGFETSVLVGATQSLSEKRVKQWIIGTHSPEIHSFCAETLKLNGYTLTVDQVESVSQPDGIIVAVA